MKAQGNGSPGNGREAIAYAEILKIAHEEGLKSITTQLLVTPAEENGRLCIVKATVETERGHFEGLGDADPANVEADFAPHLIRVAETRAKARALRDAVNVGVVSLEELDGVGLNGSSDPGAGAPPTTRPTRRAAPSLSARLRGNGQSRPPRSENGIEPMSEAQRRYLFRLVAGKGFHKEAGEEYLKDLFRVDSLLKVTKVAATKAIDELLHAAPAGASHGGAANS